MNGNHQIIEKKIMIPGKGNFCGLEDVIRTHNYDVSWARAQYFFTAEIQKITLL